MLDWQKIRSNRITRSAAQGFLAGAGLGSFAGDFAVLSVDTIMSGLVGAGSMAVLSAVAYLAFPPEG